MELYGIRELQAVKQLPQVGYDSQVKFGALEKISF
jgi:hypothetical protein